MTKISLRADPKASDGLELNWRCPYGHYVDACQKKTKQTNKQTNNGNNNNNNSDHQKDRSLIPDRMYFQFPGRGRTVISTACYECRIWIERQCLRDDPDVIWNVTISLS